MTGSRYRDAARATPWPCIALIAALVAAVAACKSSPPSAAFTTLDDDASALRSRFNDDAGAVRVVMLVAPT